MTALVLRALKTLPDEYVRDGTCVAQHRDGVVCINGVLPPILWLEASGWTQLKFAPEAYQPIQGRPRLIAVEP